MAFTRGGGGGDAGGGGGGGVDGGECILRSKNCICEYSLTVGITVSSALQRRASGSEPSIT